MSLTQFGAVISFAIEMETKISKFYEESAIKLGEKYSEYLMNRSKSAKKRKKKLEKTRRENVTEMTLEPIVGLNEDDYQIKINDYSITNINSLESTMSKFYAEAGPKINILESRRIFDKCHKEYDKLSKLK